MGRMLPGLSEAEGAVSRTTSRPRSAYFALSRNTDDVRAKLRNWWLTRMKHIPERGRGALATAASRRRYGTILAVIALISAFQQLPFWLTSASNLRSYASCKFATYAADRRSS